MPRILRDLTYIARCGALYRTDLLEPLKLTNQQASSLLVICHKPGISQDGLARHMALSKSNITRQLAYLEDQGLVCRIAPPNDKRVLQLFPTEKATALLPQIREIFRTWRAHLLQDLSEEEQAQLDGLLLKIKNRAAEWMEDMRNG